MRTGDVNKPVKGNHPFPPPGQPGRTRRAGIPWICNKHVYINSNYRCIASQDQVKTQVCKEEDCSNKCEHIGVKICLYLRNTSNCSSTCITWSHCNKWRKTSEVLGVKHRFINDMKCSISRDLQLACGHNEQIFLQCHQAFNSSTAHRYENYCNDAMITNLPWNGLELCEGKYNCNPSTTNYTNYEISYLCSANVTDICDDSVSSHTEGYLLSPNYLTNSTKIFTQCHCNMSVSDNDDDILLSLEINESTCRQSVSVWGGSSDNNVITEPAPAQSLLLQSSLVYISVTTDECHVGIVRIHYEVVSKKISRPPGHVTIRCGDKMEAITALPTSEGTGRDITDTSQSSRSTTSKETRSIITNAERDTSPCSVGNIAPTLTSETTQPTVTTSRFMNVSTNSPHAGNDTSLTGSPGILPSGNLWIITGSVIGAVILVVCLVVLVAFALKRKRNRALDKAASRARNESKNPKIDSIECEEKNYDYAYAINELRNDPEHQNKSQVNPSPAPVFIDQDVLLDNDYQEVAKVVLSNDKTLSDKLQYRNRGFTADGIPQGTMLEENDFYSSDFRKSTAENYGGITKGKFDDKRSFRGHPLHDGMTSINSLKGMSPTYQSEVNRFYSFHDTVDDILRSNGCAEDGFDAYNKAVQKQQAGEYSPRLPHSPRLSSEIPTGTDVEINDIYSHTLQHFNGIPEEHHQLEEHDMPTNLNDPSLLQAAETSTVCGEERGRKVPNYEIAGMATPADETDASASKSEGCVQQGSNSQESDLHMTEEARDAVVHQEIPSQGVGNTTRVVPSTPHVDSYDTPGIPPGTMFELNDIYSSI